MRLLRAVASTLTMLLFAISLWSPERECNPDQCGNKRGPHNEIHGHRQLCL